MCGYYINSCAVFVRAFFRVYLRILLHIPLTPIRLVKLRAEQGRVIGKDLFLAENRVQNREAVAAELDKIKPTHVLNAAGVTGRPNVDWCEDNKAETVRANVIGTLNLSDLCDERGIHCTVFATGCIFEYDEVHKLGSGGEGGFGMWVPRGSNPK